jgi:hypothetical protein
MAKFLTIDTGANGKFLIPADGFVFARKSSSEPLLTTVIFYESPNNLDTLAITYDAVSSSDAGNFAEFIENEIVDLAQTNWRNAVVDITDRIPNPFNVTNVSIG